MSGVQYPLIERCLKELQHPHNKLFNKPQYVRLSLKDNQLQFSGVPNETGHKVFYGWFGDLAQKLAREGFLELTPTYRKIDAESIKEFSIE